MHSLVQRQDFICFSMVLYRATKKSKKKFMFHTVAVKSSDCRKINLFHVYETIDRRPDFHVIDPAYNLFCGNT